MMTIFTMILLRDSLRGKAGPWNKFGSRCIQADFESAGNRVLAARIQQSVSYTFPGQHLCQTEGNHIALMSKGTACCTANVAFAAALCSICILCGQKVPGRFEGKSAQ